MIGMKQIKNGLSATDIIFTSKYDLHLSENTKIQPAKKFIPQYFSDMPTNFIKSEENKRGKNRTAKTCPSFVDVLNEGYVVPAPCDIWLSADGKGEWHWETAKPFDFIDIVEHSHDQLLNYMPNTNIKHIFKINSLWDIITPKGWSIRQMPMFYHFNPHWYVSYGIIDTDKYHELNPQILYISKRDEIFISQGEPLCYIVPFKRESLNMKMEEYSLHEQRLKKSKFDMLGKFNGSFKRNRNK